jgi:hypothetical protein
MFIISLTDSALTKKMLEKPGMLKRDIWCIVAVLIGMVLMVLPVSGALFTITQGSTAFIGEQGLDISQTGALSNTKIVWFGPGTNVSSGAPSATVSVDDAKNFYIAPSIFSGKTGPWYTLPDKQLAFYVEDPKITLRIRDDTSKFEVTGTNTYVPKGDKVGFEIETNLVAIAGRPGISAVPMTIHLRQPNGNEITQVSGYKLIDIPVGTSPFSTGPVWDTSDYQSGTYTIWAVCNVNKMKDNYPIEGKTLTPMTGNLQLLTSNPLITSSVTQTPATVARTLPAGTVQITTNTTYVATSPVQTTVPSSTTLTTAQIASEVPTSLPPATTKAPGPDVVLIIGMLGLAALVMWSKDSR